MDVQAKPHPQYKLLGAEVSLFTGKARAYMKWKGVPFKEVISTDDVYRTLITPHTSLISIPCLLIHYPKPNGALGRFEVIQDTKDIIDYFEHTFPPPPPSTKPVASLADHAVLPPSPKRAFAAMILEMLADEWLLLQAMYWRWGDGVWEKERFEEQLKFLEFEFGNTGTGGRPSVNYEETCNIGKKRLARFRGSLPNLGISPSTSATLRAQFYHLLQLLSLHFQKHPFLLGSTMSIADFAFYGHFYAHLGRDPIPSYLIKLRAPLVWQWIERVGGLARYAGKDVERWDSKAGLFWNDYGRGDSLSEDDAVPETTNAIVQFLLRDYMRIFEHTLQKTMEYISRNSSSTTGKSVTLPRSLGKHEYHLSAPPESRTENVVGEQQVWTHAIWMFQHILDRTCSTGEQRAACGAWLSEAGGEDMMIAWRNCEERWLESGWKVERINHKLVARRQDRTAHARL